MKSGLEWDASRRGHRTDTLHEIISSVRHFTRRVWLSIFSSFTAIMAGANTLTSMRTSSSLRNRVLVLLLSFAAASSALASSPSAEQWLNNYYQQPAPERFTSAMLELSRSGYFEEANHVPLAIGFIATVFAQNPDKVQSWLKVNQVLPVAHQRILISALWYSGNPKGADYLRSYSRDCDQSLRASINELLNSAPSVPNAPVQSVASLNLQWGAFLATGDTAPVRSILAALGSSHLDQDVKWSLAQNAAQHERVLAICRDELSRQPNAVQETLRAVILDAETKHKSS